MVDSLGACPDGLTMYRQIEREPCARALVVPDLGSYPCWPACLRNASLRKVTTTPSYTHSLNGVKRPGHGAHLRVTQGKRRVTQSRGRRAERGCGWEEVARRASMGLATPHLEEEDRISDGTRTSGPRVVDQIWIGAPAGATSMPRWMWGAEAEE